MTGRSRWAGALFALIVLAVAGLAMACGSGDDDGPEGEPDPVADPTAGADPEPNETADLSGDLVIYSTRREPLFEPVVEAFEDATGIDVSVKYGGVADLGNALLEEKGNPRADVFLGVDAASAEGLRAEGVWARFDAPELDAIDAAYRAEDGTWVGISGRARVIMYNTELLDESELPDSVFALTDERWKDRVAIASTSNSSVTAWVSSLRYLRGDEEAAALLEGMKENGITVLREHTDVRKSVGRGEFTLGLVNHYYYQLEKADGSPVGVIYPDQGVDEVGALVNVTAASIVEGAQHRENAEAFVKFLLGAEAQRMFAELNYEYPLVPGIETVADVKRGEFKESPVDLHELGKMNDETLDFVDEIGLE